MLASLAPNLHYHAQPLSSLASAGAPNYVLDQGASEPCYMATANSSENQFTQQMERNSD